MKISGITLNADQVIERCHSEIMNQPLTAGYGPLLHIGASTVFDATPERPTTAYTDGKNKFYCREFLAPLSMPQAIGTVLHENLHVGLLHCIRLRSAWKKHPQIANAAADYVVNAVIQFISTKTNGWCALPDGALIDAKFTGWSFDDVYEFLSRGEQSEDGSSTNVDGDDYDLDTQDDHGLMQQGQQGQEGQQSDDRNGTGEATDAADAAADQTMRDAAQAAKDLEAEVRKAIEQGALIAGRMGAKMPRAVGDAMAMPIDWRKVFDDFFTERTRGCSELSWHKFNRRRLVDDLYLPAAISTQIDEVLLAIDTSGSIGNAEIAKVVAHTVMLCEATPPRQLRVVWWDTEVRSEQIFEPHEFTQIRELLRPVGGGGTTPDCVPHYLRRHDITPDVVVVFTDGEFYSSPRWDDMPPTLWLIDENGVRNFTPPGDGISVRIS